MLGMPGPSSGPDLLVVGHQTHFPTGADVMAGQALEVLSMMTGPFYDDGKSLQGALTKLSYSQVLEVIRTPGATQLGRRERGRQCGPRALTFGGWGWGLGFHGFTLYW